MPFTMPNTPILSFDQANPWLTGARGGADLVGKILQNYMTGLTAKDMPRALQQQAMKEQFENQMLGAKAKYAEPMTLSQLQEAQARPEYTRALTNHANATAGLTNEEKRLYATKTLADLLNNANKTQSISSRFNNPIYQTGQLLKGVGSDFRRGWTGEHSEPLTNLLDNSANAALAYQQGGIIPGNAQQNVQQTTSQPEYVSQLGSLLQKEAGQAYPQLNNNQENRLKNNFGNNPQELMVKPEQYGTLADATNAVSPGAAKTPQAFSSNSEMQDRMKLMSQQSANNALTPTPMRRRAVSAIALENWIGNNKEEYAPKINEAIEYAGLKGRGKRYIDSWLNSHPNAIANYDWFTQSFKLNAANQIKLMEGMGATDKQLEQLETMINAIDKLDSNPQRAKTSINNVLKTMHQLSKSVIDASEPIHKGVYEKLYNLKPYEGNYLDYSGKESGRGVSNNNIGVLMAPDGSSIQVPADKIDFVLKSHPELRRK